MMRFIDNEQIPAGRLRLRGALRMLREERHAADHELAIEERIGVRIMLLDGLASL
jgi:hypothetical protein